ncbi:predicted protein [Uncinocarpus reesii 1704]|uniref:Zn(2)-C6 fungal-type domain-containing protein n=1 Tax=Uncinocarpus reesii (strain UAMH 1704) TaxID=336963 RepID=C4JWZ2_UNCRE|nr:uncharacterized protein UREG_06165 [Uncinocarpus reesii 1704]EEP81300.1 predicted protein [Uncinocarpus reesii 1704]
MTEPRCLKCAKKGLVCSGMGIRYRFSPGIASRGKFRNRQIPVLDVSDKEGLDKLKRSSTPRKSASPIIPGYTEELDRSLPVADAESSLICATWGDTAYPVLDKDDRTEYLQQIVPEIQILDGKTQMLFSHFSAFVAPAMVPLDSEFNGYRRIFLPLAHQDPEIKRAVCLVAALHLSSKVPELREAANAARLASIFSLKRLVDEHDWGDVLSVSNWAVIILLLAGEMIRGGSDFTYLLKMLMSLVNARGSYDEESEVHSFLMQQTKMIELFGRPFLGESEGIQALSKGVSFYCDFVSHTLRYNPNVSRQLTVSLLIAAISHATDIYLRRALGLLDSSNPVDDGAPHYTSTTPASPSSSLQHLKDLVSEIHADTPGSHTLVWVYFMGAAESSTDEDRDFFTSKLQGLYGSIGFENIIIGLANLKALWDSGERQGNGAEATRWTERLPQIESLVM